MKLIHITLFIVFTINLNAQNDDFGKISLSVVIPENIEDLDSKNVYKLESKISQLTTKNGFSSFGFDNNFIIYPKFVINDTKLVENGLENLVFIECDLILVIKQVENNVVYSTCNILLKGRGENKQIAIGNAISRISNQNSEIINFIENGKKKIVDFYNLKCNDIIMKADGTSKLKNYEAALALLLSVPSDVNCFSLIQSKLFEIYNSYQTNICGNSLQNAKAEFVKGDYNNSLNILAQIDPMSKCGREAKDLLLKIESKIDLENRNRIDNMMKIYNDQIKLEQQRIGAIKEIAIAYAKNQPKPPVNNYLLIIK